MTALSHRLKTDNPRIAVAGLSSYMNFCGFEYARPIILELQHTAERREHYYRLLAFQLVCKHCSHRIVLPKQDP